MVRRGKSERKNWAETRKILIEFCIIKACPTFLKLLELSGLAGTMMTH